jgi:caffeoyl-CoA O-methyltransferase
MQPGKLVIKDYMPEGEEGKKLQAYAEALFRPEDEVLRTVRENADRDRVPPIQVRKMDGLHMEVLARAVGARKIVEIGTLVGYSGIRLARSLPPGGRLWTFEFSSSFAASARRNFELAGVADRVEMLVGPAVENLPRIEKEGPFDLVFVDADKESYPAYFAWAEEHLRIGGILLGDNAFAFGKVPDEKVDDPRLSPLVAGVREFNRLLASSRRFHSTLLPTGEGLAFGVKVR